MEEPVEKEIANVTATIAAAVLGENVSSDIGGHPVRWCSNQPIAQAVAASLDKTQGVRGKIIRNLESAFQAFRSAEAECADRFEGIALGWLNILNEFCRSLSPNQSGYNPDEIETSSSLAELVVILLHPGVSGNSLVTLIPFLEKVTPKRSTYTYKRDARLAGWDELLKMHHKNPSSRILVDSLFGQTMLMHSLSNLADALGQCEKWSDHLELNLPMAKILEAVFDRRDLAVAAFARYYTEGIKPGTIVYRIYKGEAAAMVAFRSRSRNERQRLIDCIYERKEARETEGDESNTDEKLEEKTEEIIARIVHGEEHRNYTVRSPETKLSGISQLSCLIRESGAETDPEKGGTTRNYHAYLKKFHYRDVEVIDGNEKNAPTHLNWPPQNSEHRELFSRALQARYRYGHDLDFLSKIFRKDSDRPERGCRSIAWIFDGEIVFLNILAILRAVPDEKREAWFDGTNSDGVAYRIPSRAICGEVIHKLEIVVGKTFDDAFTINSKNRPHQCPLPLFSSESGKIIPTQRFFSLVSFLQRMRLFKGKSEYFYGADLKLRRIADALLKSFESSTFSESLDAFKRCLKEISGAEYAESILDHSKGETGGGTLEGESRLPTFLLECFLRKGSSVPQTLFFMPLTFETAKRADHKMESFVIPGAFLAGTFAGIEWSGIPSVPNRYDFHLQTTIEAIRPAIDFEIGEVLEKDSRRLRGAAVSEEMRRQGELLKLVRPPIEDLIRAIRDSQNTATRISMALNLDGIGFLNQSLFLSIRSLFVDGEAIKIKKLETDDYPEKFQSINGLHGWKTVKDNWISILLYLNRTVNQSVVAYKIEEFLTEKQEFNAWNQGGQLFEVFRRYAAEEGCYENKGNGDWGVKADREIDISRMYGLLRLLTVDSMMSESRVHLVQIVATVARFGKPGRVFIKEKEIDSPWFDIYKYSTTGVAGIRGLCKIIEEDPSFQSSRLPESPNELHCFAQIDKTIGVARFLKALEGLLKQLTRISGNVGMLVTVLDWSVKWYEGGIFIEIVCNNSFNKSAKKALVDYSFDSSSEYHDLRHNVKELGSALGSYPSFVGVSEDMTDTYLPKATDDCPFLIVERPTGGSKVESIIRILLSQSDRSN